VANRTIYNLFSADKVWKKKVSPLVLSRQKVVWRSDTVEKSKVVSLLHTRYGGAIGEFGRVLSLLHTKYLVYRNSQLLHTTIVWRSYNQKNINNLLFIVHIYLYMCIHISIWLFTHTDTVAQCKYTATTYKCIKHRCIYIYIYIHCVYVYAWLFCYCNDIKLTTALQQVGR